MSTTQAPRQTAAIPVRDAAPRAPQPARPAAPALAAVRGRGTLGASGMLALQRAVGNRAVRDLVQAKASSEVHVHEAAKLGIGGPSGALPHLARIQRAFGRHDVTGVAAHTGAQATAGAHAMGAAAFTMAHHVAFAGSADLRTAAHEAAHVVQQRTGVALPGGVGQVGDRYERHADAVAALVVQGRSAEALLDAHTGPGGVGAGATQRQVQRIAVGRQQIKTIAALAPLLGQDAAAVLTGFNAALTHLRFPNVTNVQLNAFLNAKTSGVPRSVSDVDGFLASLARSYKDSYMQRTDPHFTSELKTIKQNQQYTALIDPAGLNYAAGVDDGASVKDNYDVALACSLFALLAVKPHLLGAGTPRELHQIFRSKPSTRNYDNDKEVAQIRIAAGLAYRVPAPAQATVSGFTASLQVNDRGKKFIIDPSGQAHTFALVYSGDQWKKFDNDHQAGTNPTNDNIRVIWE